MTVQPQLRLPPIHHLAGLLIAGLVTISVFAELLVGSNPIWLAVNGSWYTLPALTAPRGVLALQPATEQLGSAVWPLLHTAVPWSDSPHDWRSMAEWWLHATRYVTVVASVIALVSTALGLVIGWLASLERRLCDFALRHAVALCGSLPTLILVGVARVCGRFPAGLDLVVVLLVLRSVEAAHLVRTLLIATREQDFVAAARSVGGGRWHLLRWHLLPHLARPLASLAASTLASVVALEAALSLIGLGVPAHASWGTALLTNGHVPGSLLGTLSAAASLIAVAGASIVLARQVRRDRWVEQRHV